MSAQADVLRAVIGENWLEAADESGQRRLDNPEDFVRIEIELALSQKKRVIPALVNDAKMPRSTELPEGLKPFARCNAVRLTHERFRADTQSLIKALEKVLAETETARRDEEEDVRRAEKARAKDEAERLRRERHEEFRKVREKIDARPRGETTPQARSRGVVSFIAWLPSNTDWRIPIAATAIVLLGDGPCRGTFSCLRSRAAWGVGRSRCFTALRVSSPSASPSMCGGTRWAGRSLRSTGWPSSVSSA